MRVLTVDDLGFAHRGGGLYLLYQQQKEALRRDEPSGASSRALGITGDSGGLTMFAADEPLLRRRDRRRSCSPDGRETRLPRRRFAPARRSSSRCSTSTSSRSATGSTTSRPRYLGDPEQFWRIADANRAMRPGGARPTPVGRRLRITLPEGVPGVPDG